MYRTRTLILLFAIAALFAAFPLSAAPAEQTFVVSVDNVAAFPFSSAGAFNTPSGAGSPGPLLPGEAYEFSFHAAPGDALSLATMFVQSNDWFLAPSELGIALYDASGQARSGDVSGEIVLWDAGTELDQPVGEGPDQAPRQAGPNSGPDDDNDAVRRVLSTDLHGTDLLNATLSNDGLGGFTLRLENISGDHEVTTPFAPGVYVVHSGPAPLFVNGQSDFGQGLEALAEDGSPASLAANLGARAGISTPLAPVAWTVHQQADALFTPGAVASAGLEALAEDGNPAVLVGELDGQSGAAAIPRGATAPGPSFAPHGNYSFEITAVPGDHLSLATMFVQSNDWFYGLRNLPLFDSDGEPVSGDIGAALGLYDAGTEVDQPLGIGSNQAPRQAGPNSGAAQNGTIAPVSGVNQGVHITITPTN